MKKVSLLKCLKTLTLVLSFSSLLATDKAFSSSIYSTYPPNYNVDNNDVYTPPGDAIVHMFNYPFTLIQKELAYIAETGFKYIQVSPPQLSRGDLEWYGRYQPLDYRVIDGPLGTETDLQNLINEAAKYRIGIIIDVVLNHMADLGEEYDLTYPPLWAQEKYDVGPILNETYFRITEPGVYYGQCSELCGPGHGFMPIMIKAVSEDEFSEWVVEAQEEFATNENNNLVYDMKGIK